VKSNNRTVLKFSPVRCMHSRSFKPGFLFLFDWREGKVGDTYDQTSYILFLGGGLSAAGVTNETFRVVPPDAEIWGREARFAEPLSSHRKVKWISIGKKKKPIIVIT
jgi:hypothetical protein